MSGLADELPLDPADALLLENSVLGVRLWGPPTQPTLSLGKSDIWDRTWFGDRQPLVTLDRLRQLAEDGRLEEVAPGPNDTIYSVYNRYPFPCPKPGGQLILGTPFGRRARVRQKGRGVELTVTGEGRTLRACIWVSLSRLLVVIEITTLGLQEGDLWIRIYRHTDIIRPGAKLPTPLMGRHELKADFEPLPSPTCLMIGDALGIRQEMHAEDSFPNGFAFVVMAVPVGVEWDPELRAGETGMGTPYLAPKEGRISHGVAKVYSPVNSAPGAASTGKIRDTPGQFSLLATVVTTQDSESPEELATSILREARGQGLRHLHGLEDDLGKACSRGEGRSMANLGGGRTISAPAKAFPSLRKPGGYYGDIPLCSVSSTKFCYQDASPWHGDFHLNEIHAEDMLTLGQFEELMPYCEMVASLLPQAQENARDVYGLPGAMYPLVHFPLRCKGIAHTNLTWEQDMGLNGLVSKPLWLYYRYGGDRRFLRRTAYPVLRECATFCAAYVAQEGDGFYHIVPTVSPEHWGLTTHFERNRDCTSAIALTRYLLDAASGAAHELGVDRREARKWRKIAGHLAPYPTYPTKDGDVWVDVAGAPPIEYNIPVPLSPVFWGDDVGLDSEPETLALAMRTLEAIRVWEPHRPYLDRFVRPRLGIYRRGAPVGPQNLLLSYQSLHIFPATPPGREIEMRGFRGEGGFRVSATRDSRGRTRRVVVESTIGGECVIANPWPPTGVSIKSDGRDVPCDGGNRVAFDTRRGETYILEPERR